MSEPDPSRDRHLWLHRIVERYERPLLAYAVRLLRGDQERAQDAVQETLLRLCRADAEVVASKMPAWLFTVCRTRVIDMQRTNHPSDGDPTTVATREPNPAARAEQADTESQVRQLVNRLPERQQELLQLRLHAGLSYQEIAEATGMTVSNVGYQLHMAIRALRDAMCAAEQRSSSYRTSIG